MHRLNGHHALPPPSPADLVLAEIRRDLWTMREDMGGLKTGQALTLDAVKQGFHKIDKAHARITRVEESLVQVRAEISSGRAGSHFHRSGPPPTVRAGLLSRATAFCQALPPLIPIAGMVLWILAMMGVAIEPSLVSALIGRG